MQTENANFNVWGIVSQVISAVSEDRIGDAIDIVRMLSKHRKVNRDLVESLIRYVCPNSSALISKPTDWTFYYRNGGGLPLLPNFREKVRPDHSKGFNEIAKISLGMGNDYTILRYAFDRPEFQHNISTGLIWFVSSESKQNERTPIITKISDLSKTTETPVYILCGHEDLLQDKIAIESALRIVSLSERYCVIFDDQELDETSKKNVSGSFFQLTRMPDPWRLLPLRAGFAMHLAAFRSLGGFNECFHSFAGAATELGYRFYKDGGYFIPLRINGMCRPITPSIPTTKDAKLLQELCPLEARSPISSYSIPKVSVLIKGSGCITRETKCVRSFLDQSFKDMRISIYNLTTESANWFKCADEFRNICLINSADSEASARLDRLRRGGGEYIVEVDANFEIYPSVLMSMIKSLDFDPNLGCVYGTAQTPLAKKSRLPGDWEGIYRHESLPIELMIYRQRYLNRTGGFDENLGAFSRYDLLLKLAEVSRIKPHSESIGKRDIIWGDIISDYESNDVEAIAKIRSNALSRTALERAFISAQPSPSKPEKLVVFWPNFSRSNPYQRLFYRKVMDTAEVVGGTLDAAITEITSGRWRGGVTFHLHWLNMIFASAESDEQAEELSSSFIAKLSHFSRLGGRLVWTVHNSISHDSSYEEIEASTAQKIIELADYVHVHSYGSLSEIEDRINVSVPLNKVRTLRHGSYVGVYPDFVSRIDARDALGLSEEDEVLLFMGRIRPYKGLDNLLTAFSAAAEHRPRLRLLIAGFGFDSNAYKLDEDVKARISVYSEFIDDIKLQVFLAAADLFVCPYRQALTSGAILLAHSFGLPVISSNFAMAEEVISRADLGSTYAIGDAEALRICIERQLDFQSKQNKSALRDNIKNYARSMTWLNPVDLLFDSNKEAHYTHPDRTL